MAVVLTCPENPLQLKTRPSLCDCMVECHSLPTPEERATCREECQEEIDECVDGCEDARGTALTVANAASDACKAAAIAEYWLCVEGCVDPGCEEACNAVAAEAWAQCAVDLAEAMAVLMVEYYDCLIPCCQEDEEARENCIARATRDYQEAVLAAEAALAAAMVPLVVGLADIESGFPTLILDTGAAGYEAAIKARDRALLVAGIANILAVMDCIIADDDARLACHDGIRDPCRRVCEETRTAAHLACFDAHYSIFDSNEAYVECLAEADRAFERCDFDCCENLAGKSLWDRCAMDCHFDRLDCIAEGEAACQEELEACFSGPDPVCYQVDVGGGVMQGICTVDPFGLDCLACLACIEAGEAFRDECIETLAGDCREAWVACMDECEGRPGCACYPYEYVEEEPEE